MTSLSRNSIDACSVGVCHDPAICFSMTRRGLRLDPRFRHKVLKRVLRGQKTLAAVTDNSSIADSSLILKSSELKSSEIFLWYSRKNQWNWCRSNSEGREEMRHYPSDHPTSVRQSRVLSRFWELEKKTEKQRDSTQILKCNMTFSLLVRSISFHGITDNAVEISIRGSNLFTPHSSCQHWSPSSSDLSRSPARSPSETPQSWWVLLDDSGLRLTLDPGRHTIARDSLMSWSKRPRLSFSSSSVHTSSFIARRHCSLYEKIGDRHRPLSSCPYPPIHETQYHEDSDDCWARYKVVSKLSRRYFCSSFNPSFSYWTFTSPFNVAYMSTSSWSPSEVSTSK